MKVFISCSSKVEDERYLKLMEDVCKVFINKGYDLVYGAYSKGMMGICYKEFIKNNKVYGYTLKEYLSDLDNLKGEEDKVVDNSFIRLNEIYDDADICLIMPGGTGTLAELFGIMEEDKTNKKNLKIILFNYLGYYDKIIDFLDNEEFIYKEEKDKLMIVNNIEMMEECL